MGVLLKGTNGAFLDSISAEKIEKIRKTEEIGRIEKYNEGEFSLFPRKVFTESKEQPTDIQSGLYNVHFCGQDPCW